MNGTEEQPPFPGLKVEGIGEVSLPLLRQERAEEIIQLIKATSSEQREVERFLFCPAFYPNFMECSESFQFGV